MHKFVKKEKPANNIDKNLLSKFEKLLKQLQIVSTVKIGLNENSKECLPKSREPLSFRKEKDFKGRAKSDINL